MRVGLFVSVLCTESCKQPCDSKTLPMQAGWRDSVRKTAVFPESIATRRMHNTEARGVRQVPRRSFGVCPSDRADLLDPPKMDSTLCATYILSSITVTLYASAAIAHYPSWAPLDVEGDSALMTSFKKLSIS